MPAVSKAQQQAMGIAHGIQKGTAKPKAGTTSAQIAKSMKPGDVKKYAKTPRKGLPARKDVMEKLREFIRETIREVLSERDENQKMAARGRKEAYDPARAGETAATMDNLASKYGIPGIRKGESREDFHARVRKAGGGGHGVEEGYPKKHHGRRKIGSKKRRAIKKKRDARKQRR